MSMWFLASLLASPRSREPPRPRPPLGSLFSFIRRLLRMSLEAAAAEATEATLDRDLVLARRNKSEKFTRFTSFESPARRLLELDPSLLEVSLRGSSGILLSSVLILRLESLTSVFFMMNSSVSASSFGSSTNSIS